MTRRSLVAAVVGGIAVLGAVVVFLPGLLVRYDLGGGSIPAPDRLKAVTDARTQLLQALGGLVLGLGAYATWRRLRINEEELRATRDGQVTERFTRAIEQLGSDKTDVRIGGVHALARIAGVSPDDRDTVIATLCAFARGHSPWPPRLPDQPPRDAAMGDIPTLATRANDVQQAMIALARIPKTVENEWLHLPLTDLRRARLWRLNLDHALFGSANLRGARMWEASLVEADLGSADLRDTDLKNADLRGAVLWNADLRGAQLAGARLTGAVADHRTKWPEGFDPAAHGVVAPTDYTRERYRPGSYSTELPPDRQ